MNNETVQIGIAVIGLFGTALTGFIAYKMAQLHNASEAAKRAAETVAEELKKGDSRINRIEDNTKKTLIHVNDAFLIQLRLYMESTRVIAELRKLPADVEKADSAEKMFKEHEANQNKAR